MNMLPSWLSIGGIAFIIAFIINRIPDQDRRWFFNLRRPDWLTFEWAIPFIWIFIFTCGIFSASLIWDTLGSNLSSWLFMTVYLLLEVAILAYTRVMSALRSLKVGTVIGGSGFFLGLILTIFVFPVNSGAGFLLIPYLLWSPIGTLVTWQMIPLNPDDA